MGAELRRRRWRVEEGPTVFTGCQASGGPSQPCGTPTRRSSQLCFRWRAGFGSGLERCGVDDVADVELVHGPIGLLHDEPAGRVDVDRPAEERSITWQLDADLTAERVEGRAIQVGAVRRQRIERSEDGAEHVAHGDLRFDRPLELGRTLRRPADVEPDTDDDGPRFADRWARIPASLRPSSEQVVRPFQRQVTGIRGERESGASERMPSTQRARSAG